jgi:pimeloyl-ACP methyl ester carboxylesterase
MTRRELGAAVVAVAVLATGGCYGLRPAVAPMPTLRLAEGNHGGDCLVVLLPGRGDGAEDFLRNDFALVAAHNGVAADVVAAEAHMGYFREHSFADRLHEDVVAPARARGQRVWLAGISLGGLGSLLYMAQYPGEIEGAVLLSPFLGDGAVLDEIEAAGRLADWPGAPLELDDDRPPEGQEVWRRLWTSLRQTTGGDAGPPPLWLAYGTGDRLARSNRLLARELPPARVLTTAGGHDWPTWTRLWNLLTERGIPACAPAG